MSACQHGNQAELLQQLAALPLVPLLADHAAGHAGEGDAAEGHLPAGGGHARPPAGVDPGHGELGHHQVALAQLAEDRDPQPGETGPVALHVLPQGRRTGQVPVARRVTDVVGADDIVGDGQHSLAPQLGEAAQRRGLALLQRLQGGHLGPPPGRFTTPSCWSRPITSNSPQSETTWPSITRVTAMPDRLTSLPVAGTPSQKPWWVPRPVKRVTQREPSAYWAWISRTMSGTPARQPPTSAFTPSGPRVSVLPGAWPMKPGANSSSATSSRPSVHSSW